MKDIVKMISEEDPEFIAALLDGWAVHHHGYIGVVISKLFERYSNILLSY